MLFVCHFFGDCLYYESSLHAYTFESGFIGSWVIIALKTNSNDTIFAHKLDLFLPLRLGPSTAVAMLSLFVFFQVKEERNQVILDNEELQEQLDMSNTAQSAGNVKLNELKNEMIKVTEDLTR